MIDRRSTVDSLFAEPEVRFFIFLDVEMRWITILFLLGYAVAVATANATPLPKNQAIPQVVSVSNSDAEGIGFRITDRIDKHQLIPGKWLLSPVQGTYRTDRNGSKRPAELLWIAVPPGKKIQLVSVSPEVGETISGSLVTSKNTQSVTDNIKSTVTTWLEIGAPISLLGHSIQPVYVFLALPGDHSISVASAVSAALRFVDDPSATSLEPTCFAPLPDYVLNHDIANTWRVVRAKSVPRTSAINAMPLGPVYRVETNSEAITVITGDELQRAGINLSNVDPVSLRMFGSAAKPLAEALYTTEPSPWNEIPIVVETTNSGQFSASDRILFYGEASSGWTRDYNGTYHHWLSPYTRKSTYYLDLNRNGSAGRRMQQIPVADSSMLLPNAVGRIFIENEMSCYANSSFIGSGTQWVGELFSGVTNHSYSIPLTGAITSGKINVYSRWVTVDGRIGATLTFLLNGVPFDTSVDYPVVSGQTDASVAHEGTNQLTIRKSTDVDYYIDWIETQYPRDWTLRSGRITAEVGIASRYRVNLTNSVNPYIFEVSDRNNVRWTRGTSFSDSGSTLFYRKYLACEENALTHAISIEPANMGGDEYSDLRDVTLQANYLIIYDDDYHTQAVRLKNYRQQHDNITVKLIRIKDIYDQFSAGNLDPTAIRNFLRFALQYWQRPAPKYVCFFGDGDYDYRGIVAPNSSRPVPPYENGGTSTDDFYVQLSSPGVSAFDMISARIPLQSPALMDAWIDKLIAYETHPLPGSWKNKIVLCADDEYHEGGQYDPWEQTHTIESETIDQYYLPSTLERVKIYEIEYQGSYDPTQVAILKPDATSALITELERGDLVVNWIGHGNPRIWAHEQLLRQSRDLDRINPGMKLPLWVAFTCDWAYWDDPAVQSMPEALLGETYNGAIGVIAANRLTGADPNERLAEQYYLAQFDTSFHPRRSVAEALSYAKARTGITNTNSNYYHALCDPLLRLTTPEGNLKVDSIRPTPLVPLSIATTYGKVLANSGSIDGSVTVEVRGSPIRRLYHWSNDLNSPFNYSKPGRLLFRGNASVNSGSFAAPVMLPIDATYGDTNASVLAYAEGAWGTSTGILRNVHTALQPANVVDTIPPTIKIYMNNRNFRDGDLVNDSPSLVADIADSSGVNLTGEVGHRIIASFDGHDYDFTEQFSYLSNSVTQGVLETPVGYLDAGKHHLRLTVFDGANNPGIAETDFIVATAVTDVTLRNLLNWPNPIKGNTQFTFESSVQGNGTVDIYTVHGTKVKTVGPFSVAIGYNYDSAAAWDARDKNGVDVANGVYLWRLKVTAVDGRMAQTTGRAAVLR